MTEAEAKTKSTEENARDKAIKSIAQAIDPEVFSLPKIRLYQYRYDDVIRRATVALDALLSTLPDLGLKVMPMVADGYMDNAGTDGRPWWSDRIEHFNADPEETWAAMAAIAPTLMMKNES